MGIIPIQFKLDGKRPDLSKLDHILAVLAMESEKFPSQVEEIQQIAKKSPDNILAFLESKRKDSDKVKHGKEEVEEPNVEVITEIINNNNQKVKRQNTDSTAKQSQNESGKKKAVEESDNSKFCTICLERQITTAVLNCGHLSFCADCSKDLVGKECPICRSNVIATARIYQS